MQLSTFLNFGGNCREAFQFYEKNLGGKITFMMTHGESPDQSQVTPENKNSVLYSHMQIGETELMASDVPGYEPMRSAYLCLSVKSSEEAERIHALLSEGGQIFMPMAETFFAHRFAMLRDRFGTSWMVIHQKPGPAAS